VAQKERNLYGPGVVHDGGVPHGSSDNRVVRALVLLRPPGKALLPRGQCEPHDLSKHVVLLKKLGTHVIMKSHMNVICLQYRSLPLCRRSRLGAPGTSRLAGTCRGPRQVAMGVAGTYVTCTTGFGVFVESRDPLGEGPFPLVEGFAERKLSAKATRLGGYASRGVLGSRRRPSYR
jgi:hypothetical protein